MVQTCIIRFIVHCKNSNRSNDNNQKCVSKMRQQKAYCWLNVFNILYADLCKRSHPNWGVLHHACPISEAPQNVEFVVLINPFASRWLLNTFHIMKLSFNGVWYNSKIFEYHPDCKNRREQKRGQIPLASEPCLKYLNDASVTRVLTSLW